MIDGLRQDLGAALRHARHRPVLAAAVVATLAACIAATSTAIGLASAVLWRPLPFAHEGRLVFVWEAVGAGREREPARATGSRYAAWRDASSGVFESIALFGAAGFTLDTPEGAVSVRGVRASAHYFDTLGIAPLVGRAFAPGDEVPGHERVVVLSHAFWKQHFGGRRDLIGRDVRLSGEPFTVVGVMPDAVFPGWPANPATVTIEPDVRQFWVPIPRTTELDQSAQAHVFGVVGRLAPGVSAAQARDRLAATDQAAADTHGAQLAPLREQFVRDARAPLLALAGATLAILLIACANLASLHVTSFEARRSEFAVRAAIGASAGRLIRQVALEAVLTSMLGAVVGLALARIALSVVPGMLPPGLPFLTVPGLDARVAGSALVFAACAALIMTAWPIHRLRSSAPAPRGLPEGARSAVYRGLVVAQVAATVALVVVAALLAQSLRAVRGREPGLRIDGVFVANLGLPSTQPVDVGRVAALEEAVLASVLQAQGIQAAALAYDHPFEANWSEAPALVGDVTRAEDRRDAELRIVSPGYFAALGVDVIDGRALVAADRLGAPGAAVINEAFARDLGGRVLGRRIRTDTPRALAGSAAPTEFEIVGVVRNERFRGLEQPSQPAFYLSTRQFPQTDLSILARTSSGDALALAPRVRAAVRTVDRAITFDQPTTLDRILAEQLVARRMTTGVIGGLAGAALALAALGLYGLLTVLVAARRRDIGVRLAIGASPQRVARDVLGEGLRNAVGGAVVGILLALLAGRLVSGLLVDVTAADPWTLGAVAATLIAVAALAAVGPAWRAASVNPIAVLRGD